MPPSDIAIKLSGVTKQFKLYDNPISGPLNEILFFWKKQQFYKEITAVDDVNMEIRRGDVVGLIGPNGAGKTTLLKMIAGLLPVDKGSIEINGKVTALLALGVGVHPEFTGRENLLYTSMLLGMSKKEVEDKMPEMIEFAELGDFIDRPFRTYSSGMKARLLFASSMSIKPDILIVDEALATGDAYFIEKSRKKILELCKSGATIIFVSHNLSQIQELCERAYLMVNGQIQTSGSSAEVIQEYNKWIYQKKANHPIILDQPELFMSGGTGEISITNIRLINSVGEEAKSFYSGESMKIQISYTSSLPAGTQTNFFLGFVLAKNSSFISEINSKYYFEPGDNNIKRKLFPVFTHGEMSVEFNPLLLLNNYYGIWVIFSIDKKLYCEYKNIANFFVAKKDFVAVEDYALFWHPSFINQEVKEYENTHQ